MIFEDIAWKLEKIGPVVSSFNPSPFLPSAANDDREQFQSLNIGFNKKSRPLYGESTDGKTLSFFKNILK